MLEDAGMMQSMPRVAHCIDNGPMEGSADFILPEPANNFAHKS